MADQEDCVKLVAGTLPDGQVADTDNMAAYVARLLADLPPRFMLAGFSLGGLVALEMIAQAPDRIAGLALICAGAGAETTEGAKMRRADEDRAAAVGMKIHALRDMWPRFCAGDTTDATPFVDMAHAVGSALYRVQNDLAISRADSVPRLARIDVPVLLVSGAQDELCPQSRHENIHADIPQVKRVTIKNAGHMICFDQPAELGRVLEDWAAEIRIAVSHGPSRAALVVGGLVAP